MKEDVRGVWIPGWVDQLRQDLRDAARRIKRQPAFASLVILTLALGIGLTTAVYSVVNAVLVRPLSIPDPERLVWLTTYEPVADVEMFLGIDFVEWKAQAPVARDRSRLRLFRCDVRRVGGGGAGARRVGHRGLLGIDRRHAGHRPLSSC